jgi:type II secretory pathway pseudopilin PulG
VATPVRKRESGYALLFIFLTVAIVGIMYYAAMPHVVFEAQRDQEQMLIDRGEQYERAIQLYYRKFRKYPQKIDDLENTSGQRFLRQRYKDPMTGKDEWRPIHIGPNGQFIDSLTQKSNQKKQDPASVNNFITELKPLGDTTNTGAAPVNLGLRKRPSDSGGGGGGSAPPEEPDLGLPTNPSDLNDQPVIDGQENPNAGPAGAIGPGGQLINPNNPNGANVNGFNGNGFNTNGVPNNGFNPNGANSGGFNPNGNNFDPNNPNNGIANQNQIPSGPNMIRNLLTSPRPGGPPPGMFPGNNAGNMGNQGGFNQPTDNSSIGQQNQFPQPSTTTNVGGFNGTSPGGTNGVGTNGGSTVGTALGTPVGAQGGFGGGGIAGFASKAERPGIKIYNEKQKYNEWEFIYDYAKDKTMGGGQTIPTQTGNGLNGQPANGGGNSPAPSTPSTPPTSPSTQPTQPTGP